MIIVFGADGQVGKELSLSKLVKSIDRAECDITNSLQVDHVISKFKPDAVINGAAFTDVSGAETNTSQAYAVNADGVRNIARACYTRNVPLIHISTDYVFDGSGQNAWRPHDLKYPLNVYGKSKSLGEDYLLKECEIYAIVRTSWVFSAHRKNFVKSILAAVNRGENLSVVKDQIGGPTSAASIAATCIEIAQKLPRKPELSGIYHYSGFPDVSWYDFACYIINAAGINAEIMASHSHNFFQSCSRPLNSRLDCKSLEKKFDIIRPLWANDLKDVISKICGED